MVNQVPQAYLATQPEAIVSYNYTDIAEGSGIAIFNGMSESKEGTSTYILTTSSPYSNDIVSAGDQTTSSFVKVLDKDFDVDFNVSQSMKGTAFVNITLGLSSATTGQEMHTYAIIKLRKWNGTTETEIASGQTDTLIGSTSSRAAKSKVMAMSIEIADSTPITRGTTLRVTVEIWAKRVGTGGGMFGFGHDPLDRNDVGTESSGFGGADFFIIQDVHPTTFIINIPFEIID